MADNIIFNSKVTAENFAVGDTNISDIYATKKELEEIAVAGGGDGNTKYSLSKSGSTITLTGSDGTTTSVTDADTHIEVIDSISSAETTKAASANATKIAYDTAVSAKQAAAAAQATANSKATTTYVDNAVASMVDSAPDTLNTLNELAAALGDDPNFATTVANQIGGKVSKSGDTMTGALSVPGIGIIGGADLNLFGDLSSSPDSGDIVFRDSSGTEIGRIYKPSYEDKFHVRFSETDSSKEIIHSGNIGSQSVNYANSAGSVSWGNISGKPSTFPPDSHTHSYLPLSGGAMTGNISYAGSQATYSMIRFIDNASDTYGNGISIGGGGVSIFGAGEAATEIETITSAGSEDLFLGADEVIHFYTNVQSGIDSATHTYIDKTGKFTGTIDWGNINSKPTTLSQFTNDSGFITSSGRCSYATSAGSVAWGNISGKPGTFPPDSHTHTYITPGDETGGATVRSNNSDKAVITGGWATHDAGYGSQYGTTLDISGYSSWYQRLAFHTNGDIDYWQGINTKTLSKVGRIITSANIGSQSVNYANSAATVLRNVTDNTDVNIWKVYSDNNDGEYGFRLQYDASGSGNNNSLSLVADNQNGAEVVAMKMLQDGTTTFAKTITASGGVIGNATSATKATQDGNGNTITSTYLPLSGGTMTGRLQVHAPIFGYNYTNGAERAAFVFDKPGSNFTGIGANGEDDTIYFGAVSDGETGAWNDSYKQKWKFNGDVTADSIFAHGSIALKEGKSLILRSNASWISGISYDTSGNECIALWAKNSATRLRWNAGTDMSELTGGMMMNITPDFEVDKSSGTVVGRLAGQEIIHSGNIGSQTVAKASSCTGNAATATLLKPTDNTSTVSAAVSSWDANSSGGKIVWREAFKESSYGTDTGDMVLWVNKNTSANGTELNLTIDGNFYAEQDKKVIHSGNIGSQSVNYANSAGSVAWGNVTGKPSIPSVGNGTLTITQNGVSKGTFTANQSGDVTIALTDNNTTYSAATIYTDGLMSADDKTKLDNLATEGKCHTAEWANNVAWGMVYGRPTTLQDWPGVASRAYTADKADKADYATEAGTAKNLDTGDNITIDARSGDGYIDIYASSTNGYAGIIFHDGDGNSVSLQDILDYISY